MGNATVSLDYGSYKNFDYKSKTTDIALTWEAPAELEDKYKKAFNDEVTKGISALEKELRDGVKTSVEQLKKWDDQFTALISQQKAGKKVDVEEAKRLQKLEEMLPTFIKSQIEQKKSIFESLFDKFLKKATDAIASKLKMKIVWANVKKGLKIAAIATLFVIATAAAITATVLTFGVAAGPIIAAVGLGISSIGGLAGLMKQSKGVWAEGKNEAKNLEAGIKQFAEVAKTYDGILKRHQSQLAIKKAQLANMGKELVKIEKAIETADGLKKNMPEAAAKNLTQAKAGMTKLVPAMEGMAKRIAEQESLVTRAVTNKDFGAAVKLAEQMKEDAGIFDKVLDGVNFVGGLLGSVGGAVGG